jgi:uncharacterized protein YxeA
MIIGIIYCVLVVVGIAGIFISEPDRDRKEKVMKIKSSGK